jgi:long-chain fatty acid transport protein
MTRRGKTAFLAVLALLALGLAGRIAAQPAAGEVFGLLQYNFSNPGARSLRLGGAFNAIADDATAAYSNPAGLINVSRPEVSIEGKSARYTTLFTDHGHGFGEPTGVGNDTVGGIQEGRTEATVRAASFASFVHPARRWAFAVYRHELANFRASFNTRGIFVGDDFLVRAHPTATEIRSKIVTYATAAAWRIHDDARNRLSIGASVGLSSLELDSSTDRFDTAGFFGPPAGLLFTNVVEGSGSELSATAGVLWRHRLSGTRYLRMGLVYRHGPGFDVQVKAIGAPNTPFEGPLETEAATLHVPGIIGGGVALETGATTISLDVNRVGYSQLIQDVANTFNTRNGIEVRAGVERTFQYRWRGRPRFMIAGIGAWRDPDHQLAASDPASPLSLIYRRGSPVDHLAGGFSLPISNGVTIDAAFDHSDRQEIFSISAVLQLPSH